MLTQFHTITPLTQLILIPSHDNRIKIYFVDDYVAYFSQLILQEKFLGLAMPNQHCQTAVNKI